MLTHRALGPCELLRIEGTIWVVRHLSTSNLYRIPPTRRHEFQRRDRGVVEVQALQQSEHERRPLQQFTTTAKSGFERTKGRADTSDVLPQKPASAPSTSTISGRGGTHPNITFAVREENGVSSPSETTRVFDAIDPRLIRRVIRSLRTGLTPTEAAARYFAIGIDDTTRHIKDFLNAVKIDGGEAMVIRGAYGQGKTFTLQLLEEMATNAGYMVVSSEIDATENRLDKPHHVYASMMRNLKLPGQQTLGLDAFVQHATSALSDFKSNATGARDAAFERYQWLLDQLDCKPLCWLLSDRDFARKSALLKLLAGDTDVSPAYARMLHVCGGKERTWPRFRYGTQGDFGSYLLSGLGLLSRLLGFNGLIVIMDEMEKWQDLNWFQQSRAGNFLGGLIWSATAETGRRSCAQSESYYGRVIWANCDHPRKLGHSGWAGGYPFTTGQRCHLGVAIAMTPRGESGPETSWKEYGKFSTIDLPEFDQQALQQYLARIGPLYTRAFGIDDEIPAQVYDDAIRRWRLRGDRSARSAVTSILEALDCWQNGQSI